MVSGTWYPTTSDILASSDSHHPLLVTASREGSSTLTQSGPIYHLLYHNWPTLECSKLQLITISGIKTYIEAKMIGEQSSWLILFHVLSISNSRQAHYVDSSPGVSSHFDKSLLNNILSHPSGDTQQYKWSDTLRLRRTSNTLHFSSDSFVFWNFRNVLFSNKNCKAQIKYNLKTLEDFLCNLVFVTLLSSTL